MGRVERSAETVRVYWRCCEDYDEIDDELGKGFIRCDNFPLEDVARLVELSQLADYITIAGKEDETPFKFCNTELVLGNPETHQVDHVNIWVDYSDF